VCRGSITLMMGPSTPLLGRSAWALRTPASLYGEDLKTVGEFTVEAGQSIPFVLSYGSSFQSPRLIDPFRALEQTEAFWRQWSDRCPGVWPWTEEVKRSLITLKSFDLRADRRDRRRGRSPHLLCQTVRLG